MSTKLTIKEAVDIIPVSESSLRRAIKSGEISSEKDLRGRRLIDVSELVRVYGELKSANRNSEQSDEYVNNGQVNAIDTSKVIDLLEAQNVELKEQITELKTEKIKLFDLAERLQKQNELLMLPNPKKMWNFWGFFKNKRSIENE